jgi:PAB1-binding protein PBP1
MLVINAADFVEIAARDLPMATGKSGALGGFTDTEISGAKVKHGEERELTKWEGGEDNPSLTLDAPGTEWDQFATNEEKFGVTTTYNERMYTTDLNKSSLTPAQIARAEKMAREIEGDTSMTDNIHVREDRGVETEQDKGMDEEDRHSSVLTKDLSQRHESQGGEKKEPSKKPFKLNPNSKPFEFNPGAAAFQPGGMSFTVRARASMSPCCTR